jgi:hypothetical protein
MKKIINYIVSNKETIMICIKLALLFFTMIQGFFLTYGLIWFVVGLPQTNWAICLLYVTACLSEYGFYRWIRSDDK